MSILTQAEEIINGQRAADYGDALENHQRIATFWNSYLTLPPNHIKPEDVATMMILLKIARFMENGYHQDTVVDIAGYAGVLEKMQLPKEERYVEAEVVPRVWENWDDIPAGVRVNSEDEEDGYCPWTGAPGNGPYGQAPWREVLDV